MNKHKAIGHYRKVQETFTLREKDDYEEEIEEDTEELDEEEMEKEYQNPDE